MLRNPRVVRKVAREISDAADGAFDAYRKGGDVEEPQITGHILGAMGDRLRSRSFGGIAWTAHVLRTGPGTAAEEERHGADLMGVLNIDLPEYQVKKGFLAQAKKAEPYRLFSSRDWQRLRSQCDTMLKRTPASFVFIYSRIRGIRICPAISILGLRSRHIFDLYDHSLPNFFENHIESFIGDRRLNSPDIKTLDALDDLPVKRVFELSAKAAD